MHTQTFSSNEVVNIARITPRMLQWWTEHHVVTPRMHGKNRIFELHQAVEVATIAELRRRGVSLQAIRRPLRYIQREIAGWLIDRPDQLWLIVDPTPSRMQDNAAIVDDCGRVLHLMKTRLHPQHVIDLAEIIRRVEQPIRRTPVQRYGITRYQ